MRLKAGLPALMLGTTALIASPARAQDGAFLGTLVLGTSKRAVQTETATPVTEINQEEMDDRQAGTVAELIDSVPGVSLVNGSTPSGSGINIRGFGANGTYGSDQKVKVQIDGADVGGEELYRIGTQLYTDPMLFREVSVVRGTVGSFEFGSGIVGGVVKLETKDASDFTGGQVGFAFGQTVEFSSNGGGITSSSILAWQPVANLELLVNYTWRDQGNQTDGRDRVIGNSAFTLPSGLIKARYRFGDHSLTLALSQTETSDRDVPYDSFTTTADAFGNVDRDVLSRTAVLTYRYKPAGNDLVDLEVALSQADQQIDQAYVPGSSPLEGTPDFPTLLPLVEADHRYRTTKLSVKNRAWIETGIIRHDLRAGVEFIYKKRLEANAAPGGTDRRIAAFVVDDMAVGDWWTVSPALRYERSVIRGAMTTTAGPFRAEAMMGGLSVRRAFANGVAVFGSAAYTESLPIIDDLGTALIGMSEKARTYELGASFDRTDLFTPGDRVAVKVNAYWTGLYDITSYTAGLTGPGLQLDRVEMRGVELEASYGTEAGYYVDFNANHAKGREFAPSGASARWRNSPADSARLTVGRRFGEAVDLSWEVVANRAVQTPTKRVPGFGVHNLRLTWSPQSGALEGATIRAGIENLFDRAYTPRLSTRPASGRNFKVTLSRVF
ncbi:MAG: TonB-dependent receptor [Pseudooceanicola sp.]|nr:TonB-dependent receptor [Pseudooceanicola sp.]